MTEHAAHFDSAERQAHAARLGMWIFLSSELLLFAGLFTLYGAYRAELPEAFADGIAHSEKLIGSVNTGILLISSACAAVSVEALRHNRRASSLCWLLATELLGIGFLLLKFIEYAKHFELGIYPGGRGLFFAHSAGRGLEPYWTLYFVTTGLHALHVAIGVTILVLTSVAVYRGSIGPARIHPLHNATLYWHLVDLIWIFLWPLYYLAA